MEVLKKAAILALACGACLRLLSAPSLDPGGVSVNLANCEYYKAAKQANGHAEGTLSVRLAPMAFLDNVFHLPEKTAMPVTFAFHCPGGKRPKPAFMLIKVPEQFAIVGCSMRLRMVETRRKDGFNIYKTEELLHSLGANYDCLYGVSVLLRSELPPGDKLYPLEYWAEYKDVQTAPYTTNLKVVPFFQAATPKIFKTGCISYYSSLYAGNAAKLFVDIYKNSGFNAFHLDTGLIGKELMLEMRKAGIERYWSTFWLADGYSLGQAKKPENVKFRFVDGSAWTAPGREGLCPVEAYENGEYFQKHVIGYVEEMVFKQDIAEHVMPNWEPYAFDFKGCFCGRCKEEFIKHSKLPREEVEKKWPGGIIASFRDQWIKFRSWQHARVVESMQKGFDRLGEKYGRPVYFIPAFAFSCLIPEAAEKYRQYWAFDYIDKLPWIEPWGTYIYYQYIWASRTRLGIHMNTYVGARQVKENIAAFVKDPMRRPKTLAYPHGYQCVNWVTTPEAISFETLGYFLNGWEGSFAYFFPEGYDYRYWRALAKANNLIAHYEDFVFKGKPDASLPVKAETPVPGPAEIDQTSGGCVALAKKTQAMPLLLGVGFQLGERHMVAVGNFWQDGEAFARLQATNLDNRTKYVLWQPDQKRCFGNENGEAALTATELGKGMLLHVGALRWEFFVVEPYQASNDYGETISQKWMAEEKGRKLPGINAAYAKEIQRQAEMGETAVYSFAEQPELNAKEVLAKPRDGMSSSVLRVVSPEYSLDLDMGKGAKITSWKRGGIEFAASLGIGSDAFWMPSSSILESPYRLLGMKESDGGVKVSLERKITSRDDHALRGLVINKTYEFRRDSFTVSTCVKNQSKEKIAIAYRMHNMPAQFDKEGWIAVGGKVLHTPKGAPVFFRNAVNQGTSPPFGVEERGDFTGGAMRLGKNGVPVGTCVEVSDAADLLGLILWDSPTQATSSLEAAFKPAELAPGDAKTYSEQWSLIKASE